MNSKNLIIVVLIFTAAAFLEFSGFAQSKAEYRENKRREYLEKYPLPAHNVRLKLDRSFPGKNMTDKGISLKSAVSIATDSSNNLFVSDISGHKVLVFDSSGAFLKQIGRKGRGLADFRHPTDVRVRDNFIVVNDTGNQRVQYLDFNGKYVKGFKTFKAYFSMVIQRDGNLFLLNTSNHRDSHLVDVLSPEGILLYSFGEKMDVKNGANGLGQLELFSDQKGDVFLAFLMFAQVRQYSSKGKLLREIHLDDPQFKDKVVYNKEQLKSGKKRHSHLRRCFNSFWVDGDRVFIARYFPRLEIVEFDFNGKIKNVFWNPEVRNYLIADLLVKKENGKYVFYIARVLPDRGIDKFTY